MSPGKYKYLILWYFLEFILSDQVLLLDERDISFDVQYVQQFQLKNSDLTKLSMYDGSIFLMMRVSLEIIDFQNEVTHKPLMVAGVFNQQQFASRKFHMQTYFSKSVQDGLKVDLDNWNLKRFEFFIQMEYPLKTDEYGILLYETSTDLTSYQANITAYLSEQNECFKVCSNKGFCFKGKCVCFDNFAGFDCSLGVFRGEINSESKYNVPAADWVALQIKQNSDDFRKEIGYNLQVSDLLTPLMLTIVFNQWSAISTPAIPYEEHYTLTPLQSNNFRISSKIINTYQDLLASNTYPETPFVLICFTNGSASFSINTFKVKISSYNTYEIDDSKDDAMQSVFIIIGCLLGLLCLILSCYLNRKPKSDSNQPVRNPIRSGSAAGAAAGASARAGAEGNNVEGAQQSRQNHTLSYRIVNLYMPIKKFQEVIELYPDIKEHSSECMVCLIAFQSQDQCRLTICFHLFHSECLIAWLKRHENCPFCRYDINRKNLTDEQLREQLANSSYANQIKTIHFNEEKKEPNSVLDGVPNSLSMVYTEQSKAAFINNNDTPLFRNQKRETNFQNSASRSASSRSIPIDKSIIDQQIRQASGDAEDHKLKIAIDNIEVIEQDQKENIRTYRSPIKDPVNLRQENYTFQYNDTQNEVADGGEIFLEFQNISSPNKDPHQQHQHVRIPQIIHESLLPMFESDINSKNLMPGQFIQQDQINQQDIIYNFQKPGDNNKIYSNNPTSVRKISLNNNINSNINDINNNNHQQSRHNNILISFGSEKDECENEPAEHGIPANIEMYPQGQLNNNESNHKDFEHIHDPNGQNNPNTINYHRINNGIEESVPIKQSDEVLRFDEDDDDE